MVSICLYFHVHQPYRLAHYNVFDIGNHSNYFDDAKNEAVIHKVAEKCYLPTNKLLLKLIKKYKGKFKVSFSITGTIIEQFEKWAPEVLDSFKDLAETGCVEFVGETYYHSLAFLFSKKEFREQVELHNAKIKELFNQEPRVFRNTELIFNNSLARYVENLGYKGVLAEGADHVLGWRSPNFVYSPVSTSKIKALLKNYKLSDDIAFRFGNKGWSEFPLTVDKYVSWINSINGNGHVVNLFMDYETFGEHQWADTGIFEFLEHLPDAVLSHPDNDFKTVGEVVDSYEPVGNIDVHNFVSWADLERDLSAWLGNPIQDNAAKALYALEDAVKKTNDSKLLDDWRKLTTSDHFYYMCTKWFNDGDVHKYFNPYDSPYEAFISFMNVINDIIIRIRSVNSSLLPEQTSAINLVDDPGAISKLALNSLQKSKA